jgi:hypothetical protein
MWRNIMNDDLKKQQGLLIGALVGAILGAGTAYLLMTAPSDLDEDERNPLSGGELLSLTSAAAVVIRRLDDIRRRV